MARQTDGAVPGSQAGSWPSEWYNHGWSDRSRCLQIEIAAEKAGERPTAGYDSLGQTWPLSISHTDRGVLVALGHGRDTQLGVDLTPQQTFSPGFLRLWFLPAELDWLRQGNATQRAAFLWAAKEALYKALNHGEAFDPRHIEVLPGAAYRYRGQPLVGERLRSWSVDGQVAVVAVVRRPDPAMAGKSARSKTSFLSQHVTR